MKRFLSLVLISTLLAIPTTSAAPKKITVKPLKLITTISKKIGVAGVIALGKSIVMYGTLGDKSFARAIDATGQELWNISLDPNSPSVATAAGVDSVGNLWIAGATSLERATTVPTPTSTPLNPDNVTNVPDIFSTNLNAIALWRIPAGTSTPILYTAVQPSPVLVTAMALDKTGITLVGLTQTGKGNSGFVISANLLGEFGKALLIGQVSTTLDAVARNGDGTVTATGASAETLNSKKVVGVIDGVIIKVSSANTVLSIVRSSAPKAKRNWSSASPTLLLGGTVITGKKIESAVTKFSKTYVPSWTYRFGSTGPIFTLGSTNAFFTSTSAIAQLSNWVPKKPQPILLTFDTKGVMSGAFSAPSDQAEVIGLTSSNELGILCVTVNAQTISIYSQR